MINFVIKIICNLYVSLFIYIHTYFLLSVPVLCCIPSWFKEMKNASYFGHFFLSLPLTLSLYLFLSCNWISCLSLFSLNLFILSLSVVLCLVSSFLVLLVISLRSSCISVLLHTKNLSNFWPISAACITKASPKWLHKKKPLSYIVQIHPIKVQAVLINIYCRDKTCVFSFNMIWNNII